MSKTLLATWLLAWGASNLFSFKLPLWGAVLGLLALATGVMILLDVRKLRISQNPGTLVLSIWLILLGIDQLFGLSFPANELVLGVLALAAGILFLFRR